MLSSGLYFISFISFLVSLKNPLVIHNPEPGHNILSVNSHTERAITIHTLTCVKSPLLMLLPVRPGTPAHLSKKRGLHCLLYLSRLEIPFQKNGDDRSAYDTRLLCKLYQKLGTLITWHRAQYMGRVQ